LTAFFMLATEVAGASSAGVCDVTSPHVVVHFDGEWDPAVKEEALSDLAAALAPQQMSVCTRQADLGAAAAVVTSRLLDGDRVRIEVDDSLTKKRVSRDVSLKDPKDPSSALIVAVAIDELLRATWAELSLERRASPEQESDSSGSEEPPLVSAPAHEAASAAVLPRQRFGLGVTIDFYPRASSFWGGDVIYGRAVSDRVEWTVQFGPRIARSGRASSLGEVQAEAVTMGGVVGVPLVRQRQLAFGPELSLQASYAWFRGRGERSTEVPIESGEFRGWSVAAGVGFSLRVLLDSAFVSFSTRAGAPLLALEVTDDDGLIGGMSGLQWNNQFHLGWWWK
jgi:hypothetical protein